ncbi:MAG TPA: sulfur carrier protein ThiS [Bacteroidales bacterium]|nr:sulfur carrier protein ThiS [Bacteroidales bacterium]HOK75451.1 sulfur carrier protein ThiS [Bacteroidales bacterium]HOM40104.1 sulfur carrier protein ThiS [Bacteroidales bacterium]HOU29836.1 sulfur carrier protein ThiS [Bacteroidales bacterium]HPP93383.1 sulfur carrier protein ThiS [Bacteroidales bacterium]
MKILLNNRVEEFDAGSLTVQQLLEIKKYSFRMRTVKVNGRYVPPAEYDKTIINDGDNVQVIYLMSGG